MKNHSRLEGPLFDFPTPPNFLKNAHSSSSSDIEPLDCMVLPNLKNQAFDIWLKLRTKDNQRYDVHFNNSFSDPLETFTILTPPSIKSSSISLKSIFELWSRSYNFGIESKNYFYNIISAGRKPSVAFTILHSHIMGGGPIMLFRYAHWLTELGINVAIYSSHEQPRWLDIKSRFYNFENAAERYSRIKEDVIIVYSILTFP